jgi:hypothetical protein
VEYTTFGLGLENISDAYSGYALGTRLTYRLEEVGRFSDIQ